jgi:hypothetical protein
MFKKIICGVFILSSLNACSSWFTSSTENPDTPAVGGHQESSSVLFGETNASSGATNSNHENASAPAQDDTSTNASEPAKAEDASQAS